MKKILFCVLFSLLSVLAFSQSVDLTQLTTKYVEKGNDEIEYYYLNDKLYSGKIFAKHPNGKIGMIGEVTNGQKTGKWTYWYSTGEKKRESVYENGKKEGTTYYWHKNGQVAKEITYRNDVNIDQKLWDEKGNRLKNPSFESFK